MQFKKVKQMKKASAKTRMYCRAPYYRVDLSLKENKNTGLSQHETLLRLSALSYANVYYACPMVFETVDVYKDADLERLMMVDVSTAPPGWATGSDHHIVFRTVNDDNPLWCSEPIKGHAFNIRDWLEYRNRTNLKMPMEAEEILRMIRETYNILAKGTFTVQDSLFGDDYYPNLTRYLPESMCIIEFEHPIQ